MRWGKKENPNLEITMHKNGVKDWMNGSFEPIRFSFGVEML
jgi:hypothetical protein